VPEFDFASMVEETEPYAIVLKREKDEQGNVTFEDKVTLPPVLPANLMLKFYDMDRKRLEEINKSPRDQMRVGMDVIESLVGKEEWDRVIHTIGISQIDDLMLDIFNYYGLGKKDTDEAEGKEKEEGEVEEQSPSTPSSTTSEASTPISNGSTPTPGEDSTEESSAGTPSSPESRTFPLSHSS
jgi:hypothetical protein